MSRDYTKLERAIEPQTQIWSAQRETMGAAQDTSTDEIDYDDPLASSWYPQGPSEHDLVCSAEGCSRVLMVGWTREEALQHVVVRKPTIARCKCGGYSVLACRIEEPSSS
jgi:hypothetical protein